MRRLVKVLLLALGIALLAVLGAVLNFLARGGAFKTLDPHFAGSCVTLLTGGPSAEDIQIDHEQGVAYLSALDRRALIRGEPVRGTVLKLDLNASPLELEPALSGAPADFRPHGLSLFIDAEGRRTLLVISHPPPGHHTVERFEQRGDSLFEHRETIASELLTDPNDLVAVGPRQFYLVNDSGAQNTLQRVTEMLFARGLATVVHYDGARHQVALVGLASPAGINVIADRRLLVVGETLGQRLRVFSAGGDEQLRLLQSVELGSGVDNIDVARDGALWVAAHPNFLALVRHFASRDRPAPSQIFRVILSAGEPRVEEVYLDGGEGISAASVAASSGGRLLIGSITEAKVLVCDLPPRLMARVTPPTRPRN